LLDFSPNDANPKVNTCDDGEKDNWKNER